MILLLPVIFTVATTLSGQVEESHPAIPQLPNPNTLLARQYSLKADSNVNREFTIRVNCKPKEPAAFGITVHFPEQVIQYIDPNSDLYGRIVPGDVIVSANGIPYREYYHYKMNFGTPGEQVNLLFVHQDGRLPETIRARKKPISSFGRQMAAGIWRHAE